MLVEQIDPGDEDFRVDANEGVGTVLNYRDAEDLEQQSRWVQRLTPQPWNTNPPLARPSGRKETRMSGLAKIIKAL